MSPYERGLGGNALRGDGSHVSPMEVTPKLGKGAQDTWRFSSSGWVAGLIKPAQRSCWPGRRGWRQTGKGRGVYGPAFKLLLRLGRPTEDSQGFKPDPGNLAVRDYRGASGNVAMVGLCTRPAIERAGTVTPHLQRGAPDFYPNELRTGSR
jgi:hypothetical protein